MPFLVVLVGVSCLVLLLAVGCLVVLLAVGCLVVLLGGLLGFAADGDGDVLLVAAVLWDDFRRFL